MTIRYKKTPIFTNNFIEYKPLFDKREIKYIRQYATRNLSYPDNNDMKDIQTVKISWKIGDAMWRLADKYYGRSDLWWVIAQFNQKPTDHHFSIGEVCYIPTPLDRVFRSFGL